MDTNILSNYQHRMYTHVCAACYCLYFCTGPPHHATIAGVTFRTCFICPLQTTVKRYFIFLLLTEGVAAGEEEDSSIYTVKEYGPFKKWFVLVKRLIGY